MNMFMDLPISKWTIASLIVLILLVTWTRKKLSYWKNRNIPHLQPTFPLGNLENPLANTKSVGVIFWDFYKKMKKQGVEYSGFYSFISPVFVPIDPDFIKRLLIRDFQNFHGRGFYCNERDQPMSANLLIVDGPKWKTIRYKFTPTFTSAKIKSMYKLVVDCADPLIEVLSNLAKNKQPANMKDLISRFTVDTIGSCAFGINCNSFTEDPTMYKMVHACIEKSSKFLRFAIINAFPRLCKFLRIKLFIDEPLEYFADVVTDTFEQRKKKLVYRADFLQLMKDMHEKKNNEDFDLTLSEIQAQSLSFFLGGYETSSTVLSYLFLELAENEEIQEKLRREILEISAEHNGITYDALQEMKYLQCVIDETLRKYPPITVLFRNCAEEYILPKGEVLEKGTKIIIPILAMQRDPEFYPNPDAFDPDRFTEENKKKIRPYTYLPFGEGPRNCIGGRFGLLQIKVAVSQLIKKFRFSVNKNMDTTRCYTTHFILTYLVAITH